MSADIGIAEFLDFMPDTVTIDAYVSTSVSGTKTYAGAPTSYACRIQMKNHVVIDRHGREVVASGTIYLGSADVPGVDDLLTVPANYTRRTPPIISVDREPDESGSMYTKLEIG